MIDDWSKMAEEEIRHEARCYWPGYVTAPYVARIAAARERAAAKEAAHEPAEI